MTMARLCTDVARMIGESPEEIADDDNLVDHGLDSMRMLDLVSRWNDDGVAVPFSDFIERPTLRDWWELVQRHQGRDPEVS
ncbi:phosphopantetheine-binding protein [Salinicola acroporae]|uniref:Phosphopantetheine-binding protein n=2 Tax=Salinicola acroporae TaxID=1541440 RepID=A0ABT6I4F8_9GAMM|nr:phosphopantetheine-binding protein [Salinicola acroporae]